MRELVNLDDQAPYVPVALHLDHDIRLDAPLLRLHRVVVAHVPYQPASLRPALVVVIAPFPPVLDVRENKLLLLLVRRRAPAPATHDGNLSFCVVSVCCIVGICVPLRLPRLLVRVVVRVAHPHHADLRTLTDRVVHLPREITLPRRPRGVYERPRRRVLADVKRPNAPAARLRLLLLRIPVEPQRVQGGVSFIAQLTASALHPLVLDPAP